MIWHREIDLQLLREMIKNQSIQFGGHGKLKIYGRLHCKSGKRMKRDNRVFFASEDEALLNGFRPCGHCMRKEYQRWISLNK